MLLHLSNLAPNNRTLLIEVQNQLNLHQFNRHWTWMRFTVLWYAFLVKSGADVLAIWNLINTFSYTKIGLLIHNQALKKPSGWWVDKLLRFSVTFSLDQFLTYLSKAVEHVLSAWISSQEVILFFVIVLWVPDRLLWKTMIFYADHDIADFVTSNVQRP